MADSPSEFVSRAGAKLNHALAAFSVDPSRWTCADFGSHAGGFVDCLLKNGAAKVYAVERGYGVLDFSLRRDPRVVVLERTDARHVRLPMPVRLITIDAGWTRQSEIIPAALKNLTADGDIITLVKPNYEADAAWVVDGVLPGDRIPESLVRARSAIAAAGAAVVQETESPVRGHAGNREFLFLVHPTPR